MSSTQHSQLSTTGVENEPATNVVHLGLQERLGCVLYDAELDNVFHSWWNTTKYESRCQRGDKDSPNPHFRLKNRHVVAWSEMYEVADHETGKPLVFCQRCDKQLAHPNNNNTSAGAFSTHFKSVSC